MKKMTRTEQMKAALASRAKPPEVKAAPVAPAAPVAAAPAKHEKKGKRGPKPKPAQPSQKAPPGRYPEGTMIELNWNGKVWTGVLTLPPGDVLAFVPTTFTRSNTRLHKLCFELWAEDYYPWMKQQEAAKASPAT